VGTSTKLKQSIFAPFDIYGCSHKNKEIVKALVISIDIKSLQNRVLKVCYVLLLAPGFQGFFFFFCGGH
jgi:hypothetical protein